MLNKIQTESWSLNPDSHIVERAMTLHPNSEKEQVLGRISRIERTASGLGTITNVEMTIRVNSSVPIAKKPYPISEKLRPAVETEVN